jgi:hypothetical protein
MTEDVKERQKLQLYEEWFRRRKAILNLAELDRRLELPRGTMWKVMAQARTGKNGTWKLPLRCLPQLIATKKELAAGVKD